MQRRQFNAGLALALGPLIVAASEQNFRGESLPAALGSIERSVHGRLGVAVLDPGSGQTSGLRLDERFPMCSTFKWLLAAAVLRRVDAGTEQLERRIVVQAANLAGYSPVTRQHAGGPGMTLAELCDAAITRSDNGAANLLLEAVGGPPGVTQCARALGDTATRLDRNEPSLNEGRPGDPRDTTTPRAMAATLHSALLGDALQPASRTRLIAWLDACQTGQARLRAGLPAEWPIGDKTGTGDHGSTNDVAFIRPPGRAPIFVAAYLTECATPIGEREHALAAVGAAVARAVGPAFRKAD